MHAAASAFESFASRLFWEKVMDTFTVDQVTNFLRKEGIPVDTLAGKRSRNIS